jgi:hypothetical protein
LYDSEETLPDGANEAAQCNVPDDYLGEADVGICNPVGMCEYSVKEPTEGMTGGAIMALIIFIVVLVVSLAGGIFVLCKKEPNNAVIQNRAYDQLDGSDRI